MNFKDERILRDRVSYLAIEWHEAEGRGFTGATPAEYGTMVTTAHVVFDEARLSLHRWIDAARRAGLSWSEIGALIGITKQAAQQRFGGAGLVGDDAGNGHGAIVRTAPTAFNEEAMLDEEGRAGRELVGTGMLTLRFRQTERRWEHRRVVAFSPAAALRQVDGEGWSHASTWFPFQYLKRAAEE